MTEESRPDKQINLEVEVPGTPEEVWQAIATGPGVTSWFVPAEIDEREGGDYTTVHGDGDDMKATETITAYDPPHRLATEYAAGGESVMATEWLVEAQSGGTCIVRLVSTVGGENWEEELESMDHGWRGYLANLKLYLTHFAGKNARTVLVPGSHPKTPAEAYADICDMLGLGGIPATGDEVASTADGAPPFAGIVELGQSDYSMIRLTAPVPAVALLGAYGKAPAMTVFHLYVFDDAADVDQITTTWRSWTDEHLPREVSA